MKAKLINGENSWRLEVEGGSWSKGCFYFADSTFAVFLEDILKSAGYEVDVDYDEWKRLGEVQIQAIRNQEAQALGSTNNKNIK